MNNITIETIVHADVRKVWNMWTEPAHIEQWNHASPDWECPHAENDLRVGGKFLFRMSAKDGSVSFDFTGTHTNVIPYTHIAYTMDDKRTATVSFEKTEGGTHITETFEMEHLNSEDKQRSGWQSILNNFKQYVETQ